MKDNTSVPTMVDVAHLAGVSTMTVSRALKGDGSVTEKTRVRVMRAVEQLGYVLDQTAGALSSKRTGFVAILIPTLDNSNLAETVHGITDVLDQQQKQVLLGYTNYSLEREENLIATMLRRRPDGIIVTGGVHTAGAYELLKKAQIPVIEIWDLPKNPINHVVGFSNSVTIEDLMARLLLRGYQNIAFVGGDETSDTRGIERRRGYERAVQTHGLKKHVVSMGKPPITIGHGGEAVVQLVDEWPEVQAVICVSDLSAFGIVMECKRRNWEIPKRLAVAGFGDFQISRYCYPSLTTVSVSSSKIGRETGRVMLEAINAMRDGNRLESQMVKIPHSIIEREST